MVPSVAQRYTEPVKSQAHIRPVMFLGSGNSRNHRDGEEGICSLVCRARTRFQVCDIPKLCPAATQRQSQEPQAVPSVLLLGINPAAPAQLCCLSSTKDAFPPFWLIPRLG